MAPDHTTARQRQEIIEVSQNRLFHSFSSQLTFQECMNPSMHFPVVHRPVQTFGVVKHSARKQSTKSRPYNLKASLI